LLAKSKYKVDCATRDHDEIRQETTIPIFRWFGPLHEDHPPQFRPAGKMESPGAVLRRLTESQRLSKRIALMIYSIKYQSSRQDSSCTNLDLLAESQ
jgi:hypothetical protein